MHQKQLTDSPSWAKGLIIVAWFASIAALPVCFFELVGAGMTAGASHADGGEVVMLSAGPLVALCALVGFFYRCKITGKRVAAMFFPCLLALAELTFTLLMWHGG